MASRASLVRGNYRVSVACGFPGFSRWQAGILWIGAAAHVAIEVARHWGVEVYAATRDTRHQKLALDLGAKWSGDTFASPPVALDAAIVFAPAGEIVPAALKVLRKGGTLVLGGIHMSPIPIVRLRSALPGTRDPECGQQHTAGRGRFLENRSGDSHRDTHTAFSIGRSESSAFCAKNDAIPGAAVLQVRLPSRTSTTVVSVVCGGLLFFVSSFDWGEDTTERERCVRPMANGRRSGKNWQKGWVQFKPARRARAHVLSAAGRIAVSTRG